MNKEKLTLSLSEDVIAIIRQAGPRRMGQYVDACVRVAEGQIQPGQGVLERVEGLLRKLVEKGHAS